MDTYEILNNKFNSATNDVKNVILKKETLNKKYIEFMTPDYKNKNLWLTDFGIVLAIAFIFGFLFMLFKVVPLSTERLTVLYFTMIIFYLPPSFYRLFYRCRLYIKENKIIKELENKSLIAENARLEFETYTLSEYIKNPEAFEKVKEDIKGMADSASKRILQGIEG